MRIEEITRGLRAAVEVVVKDEDTEMPIVRLAPNSESLNFSKEAELPCVVLQGPRIRANRHDYRKDETEGEANEDGIHNWELRTHRQIVDLVFRVRVFARNLSTIQGALGIVDDLVSSSAALETLTVIHEDGATVAYHVEMSDEYRDDLTPNESDVKHYEGEMVVEEVELRPEDADSNVWELVTPEIVGEVKE